MFLLLTMSDRFDFVWFSFSREIRMPDENGNPSRVFIGKRFRSETLSKVKAARTKL